MMLLLFIVLLSVVTTHDTRVWLFPRKYPIWNDKFQDVNEKKYEPSIIIGTKKKLR